MNEVQKAHKVLDAAKVPDELPNGRVLTLDERIRFLIIAKKRAFKAGYKKGVKIGKDSLQ
ncbi:MAG: hypothetical protein ACXABY_02675 [Candidatus Thorarchaeota archaeon]|jgi:hypothetical protein